MVGYWINNVIRVMANEYHDGYELFTSVVSGCRNCEVRVDINEHGIRAYDYANNEIEVITANRIIKIK